MNSRVGQSKRGFVKVGSVVKYDNLYFVIKEIFDDGESFKVERHQALNKKNTIGTVRDRYMCAYLENVKWDGCAHYCEIIETKRKIG